MVQGRHFAVEGFGLIERFSEDLDLKLEPGTVTTLRSVTNWKSEGTKATIERKTHFEALAATLSVPAARVRLGQIADTTYRSANLQVDYPGKHQSARAPCAACIRSSPCSRSSTR